MGDNRIVTMTPTVTLCTRGTGRFKAVKMGRGALNPCCPRQAGPTLNVLLSATYRQGAWAVNVLFSATGRVYSKRPVVCYRQGVDLL